MTCTLFFFTNHNLNFILSCVLCPDLNMTARLQNIIFSCRLHPTDVQHTKFVFSSFHQFRVVIIPLTNMCALFSHLNRGLFFFFWPGRPTLNRSLSVFLILVLQLLMNYAYSSLCYLRTFTTSLQLASMDTANTPHESPWL